MLYARYDWVEATNVISIWSPEWQSGEMQGVYSTLKLKYAQGLNQFEKSQMFPLQKIINLLCKCSVYLGILA